MFEYRKKTARIGGDDWELHVPELHYFRLEDVSRVVLRAAQTARHMGPPRRRCAGAPRDPLVIERQAALLMRDGSTVVLFGDDVGRLIGATYWGLGNGGPPSLLSVDGPCHGNWALVAPGYMPTNEKTPGADVGSAEGSEGPRA